jgi:hypothetical protein
MYNSKFIILKPPNRKPPQKSRKTGGLFINGSRRLASGAIQFKGKRGVWRPRKGCGCGK